MVEREKWSVENRKEGAGFKLLECWYPVLGLLTFPLPPGPHFTTHRGHTNLTRAHIPAHHTCEFSFTCTHEAAEC